VLLDGEETIRCIITPQTAARVLHVFADQESRMISQLDEEEDEDDDEYIPEEPPENQNIRAVIADIRAIFE
jgi:hypothetical protein